MRALSLADLENAQMRAAGDTYIVAGAEALEVLRAHCTVSLGPKRVIMFGGVPIFKSPTLGTDEILMSVRGSVSLYRVVREGALWEIISGVAH